MPIPFGVLLYFNDPCQKIFQIRTALRITGFSATGGKKFLSQFSKLLAYLGTDQRLIILNGKREKKTVSRASHPIDNTSLTIEFIKDKFRHSTLRLLTSLVFTFNLCLDILK